MLSVDSAIFRMKKEKRLAEENRKFERLNRNEGISPERKKELNALAASVRLEGVFTRRNAGKQVG